MLIIFSACKKKDKDENIAAAPNPVASQQQTISNSMNNMNTELSTMLSSSSYTGINQFYALFSTSNLGNTKFMKHAKTLPNAINNFIKANYSLICERKKLSNYDIVVDKEGFPFSELAGTHTWNNNTQQWQSNYGNPSNKIIFIYPQTPNGTNNCTLTIFNYSEQSFILEGDTLYLPTTMQCDLFVSGNKELDINLTAAYTNNAVPSSLSLSIVMGEYNFTLSFTFNPTNYLANFSYSFKKQSQEFTSAALAMTFNNEDLEELMSISGYIHSFNIKIQASVNINELDKLENPTIQQLNTYIQLAVLEYPSNATIATGNFMNTSTGEIDLYLVFSDGSTVLASTYFESILNTIENNFGGVTKTIRLAYN